MKILLVLLTCFFTNSLLSQDNDKFLTLSPDWKLGDKKIVKEKMTSRVFLDGNLVNNAIVVNEFTIEVIDTSGIYNLEYTQKAEDFAMDMNLNDKEGYGPFNEFMKNFSNSLVNEIKEIKFNIIIDKQNAEVINVLNIYEFTQKMKAALKVFSLRMASKLKLNKEEAESMNIALENEISALSSRLSENTIKTFDIMFEVYRYKYNIGETITQKQNEGNSGEGEINIIEQTDVLVDRIDNDHLKIKAVHYINEKDLIRMLEESGDNVNDLIPDDMETYIMLNYINDSEKNWISEFKMEYVMKIKNVKTVINRVVTLE